MNKVEKIKYDLFYFKIDHFCNHPVYSPKYKDKWYSNVYSETITSFILGIEFKIK